MKKPGIYGFSNQNCWLSNFVNGSFKIEFEGIKYPTVEHAYQAAKTLNVSDRVRISRCQTASDAKRMGQTLTIRKDWEEIKLSVMEHCLRQKFQDEELKQALISTNDLYLEETNWRSDRFWGVFNGEGENHLGKLLMKLREEIK